MKSLPITPSQWVDWQPDEGRLDKAYLLAFEGPFSVERLESALSVVIQRHEPLRTAYPIEDELPVQQIWPEFSPTIEKLDLTKASSDEERRKAIDDWFAASRLTVDKLGAKPALRVLLAELSEAEHVVGLIIPSLSTDLAGVRVLFEELCTAYADPGLLPAIRHPYSEVCDAWVDSERLAYWKDVLAPFIVGEPLPAEEATSESWTWTSEEIALIKATARRERVSHFSCHLAALAALLARSGNEEFVTAMNVASRSEDTWGLVACFSDVLYVPVRSRKTETLKELLHRTHGALMDAMEHSTPSYAIAAEVGLIECKAQLTDDLSIVPHPLRAPFRPSLEALVGGQVLFAATPGSLRACMARVPGTTTPRRVSGLVAQILGGEMQRETLYWPGAVPDNVRKSASTLYRGVLASPTPTLVSDLVR